MLWIAVGLYAAPLLYTTEVTYQGNQSFLCSSYPNTNIYVHVYFWSNILLNSVIPFLAMFTMNLVIIDGIRSKLKQPLPDNLPRRMQMKEGNEEPTPGGSSIQDRDPPTHPKDGKTETKGEQPQERSARNNDSLLTIKNKQRRSREKQTTRMLLLSSFVMLALSLPKFIRIVYFMNRN